jgi:hypothetical protein
MQASAGAKRGKRYRWGESWGVPHTPIGVEMQLTASRQVHTVVLELHGLQPSIPRVRVLVINNGQIWAIGGIGVPTSHVTGCTWDMG